MSLDSQWAGWLERPGCRSREFQFRLGGERGRTGKGEERQFEFCASVSVSGGEDEWLSCLHSAHLQLKLIAGSSFFQDALRTALFTRPRCTPRCQLKCVTAAARVREARGGRSRGKSARVNQLVRVCLQCSAPARQNKTPDTRERANSSAP